MSDIALVPPVVGELTDLYGHRGVVPGLGHLGFHTGDDYKAPAGTPITACAPGIVWAVWFDRFANGNGAGGNMVSVNHGNGYETRYAHMMEPCRLKPGDEVTIDTVLGGVGSTGAATGAHCHLELLFNGEFVNPQSYMTLNGDDEMTPHEHNMLSQVHEWLNEIMRDGVPRVGTQPDGEPRGGNETLPKFLASNRHQTGIDRAKLERLEARTKSIEDTLNKF